MPDQPSYSIGTLAQILGISEAMLRKWEDRYPVVRPGRSAAGHRVYSRTQAQQLQFVCEQVAAGHPRGTAFRLLQDRLASGIPLTDSEKRLPGDRARVLLVEQDPRSADLAEYFLRNEGHQVAIASTVDLAVTELAGSMPDLAVIDLLVSDGQGLQLCLQLHRQLRVPVLATSTLNLRAEAVSAGAAGFLLKPIQPQRLVSVVQHLLSPRSLITTGSRAAPAPQPVESLASDTRSDAFRSHLR